MLFFYFYSVSLSEPMWLKKNWSTGKAVRGIDKVAEHKSPMNASLYFFFIFI